LISEAKER